MNDPCRLAIASWVLTQAKLLAPQADIALSAHDVAAALEKPPEAHLGDYALPCFRLAKPLAMKPQDIAVALQNAAGDADGWLERKQVVGAFLNLFVSKAKMATAVLPDVQSGAWFKKLSRDHQHAATKVMIEFGCPNTHKAFHIGHGRNISLGDALVRVFRYCGYSTVAANYPGDEGTHIAKCLWYLRKHKPTPPPQNRGEWLGQMYAAATRELGDMDPEARKIADVEVSKVLHAIESKSGEIYALWQQTRQWSLDDFSDIFSWFGVHFDQYFFESEVSEDSQKIVDEYRAKGLFVESQGAIGIDLAPYKLGFLILRKTDGNTLYATKDLVLARRKFEQFKVQRSINVVGSEQNLHFRQVFKTLELMGFKQATDCFHLSYGMVTLPEGKMSSRDGNSVTFMNLVAAVREALGQVMAKYASEWTPAELSDTVDKLCIGAIKYGMLGTDPVKNIVFKLEDWISFEGDSGPYLMYSYARTRSILAKAAAEKFHADYAQVALLQASEEAELVRLIYDFNHAVAQATEQYKPSLVAHHLFAMCKSFNRFYANVSVLKAETPQLVAARLALVDAFSATLKVGLGLLGITPPERM